MKWRWLNERHAKRRDGYRISHRGGWWFGLTPEGAVFIKKPTWTKAMQAIEQSCPLEVA